LLTPAVTVDTTLLKRELVARILGLRLAVFDFDGVFTDNMVFVFQDGGEAVRCTRSDGIGLRRLERAGVEPIILSTETHPVVSARATKLKIGCIQGIDDKLAALTKLLADRRLEFSATAFVGNDINDRPCLARVGFPVVVADAHEDLASLACYRTRRPGGHGAVREVCDLIAEIRGVPAGYGTRQELAP
jgi:3-deoxy-D-manno-octulosonate 8-phosphate phosphatase (KDO 8-P phosphatase)